jgi:hypothetical protein
MENNKKLAPVLNILQLDIPTVVATIKEQVKNGDLDAIQSFIALKAMSKVVEESIGSDKGDKELKDIFLKSVQAALEGKSYTAFGATLRIQDTGVRYDFTECNDSLLKALYEIRETVKEAIDKREKEIKAIFPDGGNRTLGIPSRKVIQESIPSLDWSDDEFEEIIFPPIRRAGTSIITTFKKK